MNVKRYLVCKDTLWGLDETTCISLTNKTLEFLLVHYNKIISNQLFFEDDEKYV